MREKEEENKVRVVDKRPLGENGERRNVGERRRPTASVNDENAASPPRSSGSAGQGSGSATSFSDFLRSLGASCLMSLGAIPGQEEKLNVDTAAAESIIEVIDMLKEKTSGNLTPEEEKALTGMLAELKLLYARVALGTGS